MEENQTPLYEAEAIINMRPLAYIDDLNLSYWKETDNDDEEYLPNSQRNQLMKKYYATMKTSDKF